MKSPWYHTVTTQLRAQPPEVKSHIALIAAGVFTTLVALIWVTTLPARFATIGTLDDGVASSTALVADVLSPLVSPALREPEEPHSVNNGAPDTPEEVRERITTFRKELEDREALEASAVPEVQDTPPHMGAENDPSRVGKPVLIEVR